MTPTAATAAPAVSLPLYSLISLFSGNIEAVLAFQAVRAAPTAHTAPPTPRPLPLLSLSSLLLPSHRLSTLHDAPQVHPCIFARDRAVLTTPPRAQLICRSSHQFRPLWAAVVETACCLVFINTHVTTFREVVGCVWRNASM